MVDGADRSAVRPDRSPFVFLARVLSGFVVGFGCLLMATALLAYLLVPIAYDTIHLQDTLFFAELGWRILQGLTPHADFNHFYGGVIAQYVAWAFQAFGITVKSIDYAFVMMLGTSVALASVVSWRRISPISFVALLLIVFACVLARVPFEEMTAIQRPSSAHSFIYNRFATSLAVGLLVFVLVPLKRSMAETASACVAGLCAYLIVLIKPTFAPFLPAFLLALLVQARWLSFGLSAVGIFVAIALFDPWMTHVTRAYGYAISAAGSHTSVSDLILKTVAVFLAQPLTLLFVLLSLLLVIRDRSREAWILVMAAVIVMIGCAGMTATMGWRGSIGQQVLPFLSAAALGLYEWSRRRSGTSREAMNLQKIIALAITLSFALPHLAQSTLAGLVAQKRTSLVLFSDGPLATYLPWSDEFVGSDGQPIRSWTPLEKQIGPAREHILSGKKINVGVENVLFADGIELLKGVPDLQERGLAGNYGGFNFALQVRSIPGYPVWVHSTSSELAEGQELPSGIDLMMILRLNKTALSDQLLRKMSGSFLLCDVSPFWELYVRVGSDDSFCLKPKADQ